MFERKNNQKERIENLEYRIKGMEIKQQFDDFNPDYIVYNSDTLKQGVDFDDYSDNIIFKEIRVNIFSKEPEVEEAEMEFTKEEFNKIIKIFNKEVKQK